MKCAICSGELVVVRPTTELETNGWLVQCQGSCYVLQVITNREYRNLRELEESGMEIKK